MRHELAEQGKDIHVVAVNATTAVEQQADMVQHCSFPLLQDTPEIGAWLAHGGGKDDFYFYDAQGVLVSYLPANGAISVNLSTPEGYQNVKTAILSAFGAGQR